MTSKSKTAFVLVFSAFISAAGLFAVPSQAFAYDDENRTVNRSVLGRTIVPGWLLTKPEHYEFLPLTSNHDPQHQHPAAWEGQDWDVTQWNAKWTPDAALQKFFDARIFERQYMRGNVLALDVGPAFFKISDLDRRRTLKLLADQSGVFKNGHSIVMLTDWSTHDIIGTYTEKGMFLN